MITQQSDVLFNVIVLNRKIKGDTLTFWEYFGRVSEQIDHITDGELAINGGCTGH